MLRSVTCCALLAMALAACAATPAPNLHLLGPAPIGAPAVTSARILAFRTIALPRYARDQRIASLNAGGEVVASETDRWADDPEHAMTETLADAAGQMLGAATATEPWPAGLRPDLRIKVDVTRMIGAPNGDLSLSGRFIISSSGDQHEVLTIEPFALTAPVRGAGIDALIAAHAAALGSLAERIARSVASLRPPKMGAGAAFMLEDAPA